MTENHPRNLKANFRALNSYNCFGRTEGVGCWLRGTPEDLQFGINTFNLRVNIKFTNYNKIIRNIIRLEM